MSCARSSFTHAGLTFSYLDSGPAPHTLIALHGHLMEAATFLPLADALAPEWRILALDQRGHGHSSHAASYTRSDYISDLEAFFAHLRLSCAVLLGSSLGGVNAYQFASRQPELVTALIIEDIGATVSDDISFISAWAGHYPTRESLLAKVGERFAPYISGSVRQSPAGWHLAFDPADMLVSQSHLCGDHWSDWLATTCPALLIRGSESRVTRPHELAQMTERRPNTTLLTLPGGHILHDQPAFTTAVRTFLASL
ncbi:MAG TPA: alpha/beta hydrolase [Terracidiphilus sp.]|nr:alpha/beta hydrolase [Terracidiphilus sp.]